MTNEQAKTVLTNAAWLGTDAERERVERAVKMAIKAFDELPKRRKEVKRFKIKVRTAKIDALTELRDELQKEAYRQAKITNVEGLNIAINRINARIRRFSQ